MVDATSTLAKFAYELNTDTLPKSAIQTSALLALDTVGAAIAAIDAPGIAELRKITAEWTQGPCRVWGSGERLSPPAATLVNSSMAHAVELDDLHNELPIHSGVIVIPAALALADARPELTGRDLIAAIVAGTEVICRIARATRSYRGTTGFRGWNPTSVVAGFGTAAVAGRLLGLDAEGIARAMGLSYAQAGGNQQCIGDGGLVKRMQPGLVAEAGVRAAYLAQAGVTGAVNAIEGKNGFFAVYEHGEYDPEYLNDGLGESFEIENVCFKRYPVCGMAQPAMDSLRDLQMEHGFSLDDIQEAAVFGSKFVVDMVGRPFKPGKNPEVDAQFNLSYCIATILQTDDFTLADLAPEKTLGPDRRTLADKIPVELDPALTGKWEARVEITLKDGARLKATRTKAAWQDDRPMTEQELLAKFGSAAAVASDFFDADRTEALAEALINLPELKDLSKLTRLLAS